MTTIPLAETENNDRLRPIPLSAYGKPENAHPIHFELCIRQTATQTQLPAAIIARSDNSNTVLKLYATTILCFLQYMMTCGLMSAYTLGTVPPTVNSQTLPSRKERQLAT